MATFCPTVNGIQVLKSNFVMYWGVEPAFLTATIPVDSPPATALYGGKNIVLDLTVTSWTKVTDGVYMIQAADEPFFWKNNRLTIKYDDPVDGVAITLMADAIANETGWEVVLESEERVPYLVFSGSVMEAINVLEKLSGKFATLDHINKRIEFVDTIPHDNASEGVMVEEAYEKPSVNKVICYGTLLKLPMDNFLAANECNIPDYKYLDMAVPAEGWEITSTMPLGVTEKVVGTIGFPETEHSTSEIVDFSGNQVTYEYYYKQCIIKRYVNVVFVATTLALKQDEVLLVPVTTREIKMPDGTMRQAKTREFDGEVYFEPPTGSAVVDPRSGEETQGYFTYQFYTDRVFFLANPNEAQTKTEELLNKLSQTEEGVYIIVTPNISTSSDAKTTTSDFYFGFRAIVVGKVYIPFFQYTRSYKSTKVNDVTQDFDISGNVEVPDAPNLDLAFISLYLRERLLRNLRFKILLDGYRVKFPYFVTSDEEVGKDVDAELEGVMYIQLNEAPSIDAAINFAKLSYLVLNKTGYVGILDQSPDGATKYVEDFASGLFRAIAYYRK